MSAAVAPGDVLAGKYRVERVLGQGGMGVVVAAMHLELEKRVALKFLLPEVAQNPELVARFSREARAAGKIQSEHVTKVLDVGKLDSGVPFMVMEHLEGHDLAEVVKRQGALSGQVAIEYVLQACEALAEAHVAGIVHRDLKPANLFLTKRADGSPCIKVLDFGISKVALAGDQGQGMTQTAALMGSPNYMAPEQLRSARNVDARTDIWSLGIILQELLTGDVAFKADTVPELYVSILQEAPIPLRSRRPDAPAAMEAIVLRCLEKDPARRFANVGELATALAEMAPASARLSIERINRIVGTPVRPPSVAPPPQPGVAATQSATPLPTYVPGPPAPTYTSQVGGAPRPYGPPMGYGQPSNAPHPSYTVGPGPGHGPPMPPPHPHYAPQATAYPQQQPQQQGMTPATIALIILVTAIVLVGGTCTMCLCIGAAQNTQAARGEPAEPAQLGLGAMPRSDGLCGALAAGANIASPGAFQRPAGWTTVSSSSSATNARSRPSLARAPESVRSAAEQGRALPVAPQLRRVGVRRHRARRRPR